MVRHGGEHHPPFSHTYADVPSKLEEHPVILAEKWRSSEIARKVGTTEYEGYQCDIIRHEGTETTDSPLMQWVARDTGFPVRTEVPEKLYLLEYRNIDERPVPVSAFSIPPGYRKVETPVPQEEPLKTTFKGSDAVSLVDRARHYYAECDMNCAESIFAAADDEYGLLESKDAQKMMAGFGGGAGIEHLCGALSGAIAAIGAALTEVRAHASPQVKETCREFLTRWESRHGLLLCAPLKERYRHEDSRCLDIVTMSAELLEEVLGRALQNRKFSTRP